MGFRLAIVAGLLLVGCAGAPPRFAPGSLPAVHLLVGEPQGPVALAAEGVMRDFDDRFTESVAESRSELESLWKDAGLRTPLPRVDFTTNLVVAFAEDGFCNDSELTGVSITTAGEIVPESRQSELVCDLLAQDGEVWRIHVFSLPRRFVPPGAYVVRNRGKASEILVVHGAVTRAPVIRRDAPVYAAPPQETVVPGAHPRRARVLPRRKRPDAIPPDETAGVWVRDDAVWIPYPSPFGGEVATDLLACDDRECARGFVLSSCEAPECPTHGTLLITERPLRRRGPWPENESAWTALVHALAEDPALAEILGPHMEPGHRLAVPEYPHPAPPPVGWITNRFTGRTFEQSLGDDVGVFVRDGAAVAGADLRLGVRWAPDENVTSGIAYDIREGVVGEAWGFDLRGRALWELGATGEPRHWTSIGLAVAADNPLGQDSGKSRVRIPSLLGFVLPELGLMVSSDAPASFYTAHAFPLSLLVGPHWALEARPSFTLRFTSGRQLGSDALTSFSLSLMHR